jgi:oligopeptide transport system ATP-binding protein
VGDAILLAARDVRKYFRVRGGLFGQRTAGWIRAVDGVSVTAARGETLALVGESGCGKTTFAKLVLAVERPSGGELLFAGENVASVQGPALRAYRKQIQAVFQDPYASLSPRMRVEEIVAEPLMVNTTFSKAAIRARVAEAMEQVGLSHAAHGRSYPHEFSGGQRQRIAIARAIGPRPRLMVLDEPVSALDLSIRAQVMNLLLDLQRRFGLTYILISHDLAGVRYLSHHVAVMYLGRIVEEAETKRLYAEPRHPYTRALLAAALPAPATDDEADAAPLGEIASAVDPPPGCAFHPRCPKAFDRCAVERPVVREVAPGHRVACHLYEPTPAQR